MTGGAVGGKKNQFPLRRVACRQCSIFRIEARISLGHMAEQKNHDQDADDNTGHRAYRRADDKVWRRRWAAARKSPPAVDKLFIILFPLSQARVGAPPSTAQGMPGKSVVFSDSSFSCSPASIISRSGERDTFASIAR